MCAALARKGRLEEASRLLIEAQEKAGLDRDAWNEYSLSLARARVAAAEGKWVQALAAFEETTRIQASMGMRWYRAQTLREQAEAHLSRGKPGDRERAVELLREAQAAFEEMDVLKYAARVTERLAAIVVE